MAQTVVAFCGLPGSGKSTLAHALQERTGWRRLDRDALRATMFPGGGYSVENKQQLALAMCARLQEALRAGESVIIDGMTFSRRSERDAFSTLASLHRAHWLLVWLDCNANTAKERIRRDTSHPAADRNPALVDAVAARFDVPDDGLRVTTSLPVAEQLQILLAALGQRDRDGQA